MKWTKHSTRSVDVLVSQENIQTAAISKSMLQRVTSSASFLSKWKHCNKDGLNDEELLQELVAYNGSIDELPLPDAEPYLTEKGVTFIYQPYEISYYAAGKPEFTIPFDVVKPFLKAQAIELFLNK